MKIKLLFTALLISSVSWVNSQLPYSWITGVNPLWTSSVPSNNTLGWQSCVGSVSTSNCAGSSWYTYNNGQNTTYTSPSKNTTCTLSSKVKVSFTLDVNLENGWDFLDFEYSLNNGSTWSLLASYTGSGYGLRTYMINESPTTQFRFRFRSDGSVNNYCSDPRWWGCNETSIYFADILTFNVDCISVLPVELTNFSAVCGDNVSLKWTTASEKNSDYFLVEKSRDGIEWVKVSEVGAKGNSSVTNDYSLIDGSSWNGLAYYRLSQVDFNGTTKVYDPISVYCESKGSNVYVFPNPSDGSFDLRIISNETNLKSDIAISDNLGKVVVKRRFDIKNGTTFIAFNLDLENGIYNVSVISQEGKIINTKLVINKSK